MNLNYKTFGQGPPLIILHGLFGMLDNWQTVAKQLAEDYTVFIIDQRNHGKSPHDDEFNYEIMAEDLYEFMDDNWIYKAHLLGHSMGGKTVMQFAMMYEEMVDKLIIVDIAPKKYEGNHQNIFDALFSFNPKDVKSRKEADILLKKYISEFGVRQFLLKNLYRDKTGGYQWKMNLSVIYNNYKNILDTITTDSTFDKPVLLLRGEQSNYISEEDITNIKVFFPNSIVNTIANTGHWVHADAPNVLLEQVQTFLKS